MIRELTARLRSLIDSDGALIAFLPIAGTFVAYWYERGYLSYFSIPPSVIEFNAVKVLIGCFAVMVSVAVLVLFILMVMEIGSALLPHRVARFTARAVAPMIFFLPAIMILDSPYRWGALLGLLGLGAIHATELRDEPSAVIADGNQSPLLALREKLKEGSILLLFCLVIPPLYVYGAGYWWASNKGNHQVLRDRPTWVFVGSYANTIAISRFDPRHNLLCGEVELLTLGESLATLGLKDVRGIHFSRINELSDLRCPSNKFRYKQ